MRHAACDYLPHSGMTANMAYRALNARSARQAHALHRRANISRICARHAALSMCASLCLRSVKQHLPRASKRETRATRAIFE